MRRGISAIDPFVAIEILIVISAQLSVFVSTDPVRVPLWILSAECLAFSGLRLGFGWFRASPRRLAVLGLCELAILSAAAAQTMGGTIIVLSLGFVLRNAELLPPVRAAAISAIALGAMLVTMLFAALGQGQRWDTVLDSLVALGMAIGMSGALASFAASERRASNDLRAAHEELRRYAAEAASNAAARERARIAADLHDATGHSLTALNVHLQGAVRMRATQRERSDELVDGALELGQDALAAVRKAVSQLRADPLEHDPLDAVLLRIIARYEGPSAPSFSANVEACRLDIETGTAFARIAEEAIVNAIKHADAKSISVALHARDRAAIRLEIADDGCGFEPGSQTSGHGLNIMRERARALGFSFALASSPGLGTRVMLHAAGSRVPA